MKVIGQLEKAAFENLADASPTPTPTGRFYADVTAPTAAVPKFYDGSAWRTIQTDVSSTTVNDTSYDIINIGLVATVAASALTIALKQLSGSDCSSTQPGKISFRNSTAATGTSAHVNITSALSTIISSGSTGGSSSGNANWLYIYAINNAGVVELAWSGSKFSDTGSLVSTTAEGGAGAADSKSVLYSTTARANVACRLIGRIKSTQATAGTWATAPSEISLWPFETQSPRSEVWVYGSSGYGSSSTKILRYTTTGVNLGSAISYAGDSSTLGAVFTIQEDGMYAISMSHNGSGGLNFGASVNSSQLTTSIGSITAADRRMYTGTSTANLVGAVSTVLYLSVGDVIRPHADATTAGSDASGFSFRISKVSN